MLVFCPWLSKIWEWIYGDAVVKPKAILDFMYEVIQQHKETLTNGEPRDLIDVFLHEINEMDEDQRDEAGIKLSQREPYTVSNFDFRAVFCYKFFQTAGAHIRIGVHADSKLTNNYENG